MPPAAVSDSVASHGPAYEPVLCTVHRKRTSSPSRTEAGAFISANSGLRDTKAAVPWPTRVSRVQPRAVIR